MTSFYLKNARVRANDVDFERAAKLLAGVIGEMSDRAVASGSGLRIDKSFSFDLLARVLGAICYADVKKAAADPDVSGWTSSMLSSHLQRESITSGEHFPRLPREFGAIWQSKVMEAFEACFAAINRGQAEFIAIIGSKGSGKSILVKHMVSQRGGRWIDPSTSVFCQPDRPIGVGELMVMDVPAETYREASDRRALSRVEPLNTLLFEGFRSFEQYRVQRRKLFMLKSMDSEWHSWARWVTDNPQATLVVCFPDVEGAKEWMECNLAVGHHPTRNWRQAHVVDLDKMDVYTIEGRTLETERDFKQKIL